MKHPYELGKKKWRLIRAIQEKGYTNGEFADEVELSDNGLFNLITGKSRPSIDTAYRVAQKLGKTIEYLFFEGAQ